MSSTRPLKVLVWYWGRRGGGPRYTLELVRALEELDDLDLHLSLSRSSELFAETDTLVLKSWHIDTYGGIASGALALLRLPSVRAGFWRYVEFNAIDVIVCTMSHLWNLPVLVGRSSRVPYILVLHDALPHRGDDKPLRYWLLRQEVGRTQGIITLTEHVRTLLCKSYSYPRERTWLAPHGVFPFPRDRNQNSRRNGSKRILFFGRLLPYKGLDLLLTAFRKIRASRDDVELIIAGPGDPAPYQSLLNGLPGVTLDVRWIAEDEIGPIFQSVDICVLPYREASQSGVIAAAYAASVPAVVTPVGGLVEQVEHERTGLVCRDVSPEAIADAIERFLDNAELLSKCSQGAEAWAEQLLSWPSIARQFSGALRSAAAGVNHGKSH